VWTPAGAAAEGRQAPRLQLPLRRRLTLAGRRAPERRLEPVSAEAVGAEAGVAAGAVGGAAAARREPGPAARERPEMLGN
jgi:hypothetical protein